MICLFNYYKNTEENNKYSCIGDSKTEPLFMTANADAITY